MRMKLDAPWSSPPSDGRKRATNNPNRALFLEFAEKAGFPATLATPVGEQAELTLTPATLVRFYDAVQLWRMASDPAADDHLPVRADIDLLACDIGNEEVIVASRAFHPERLRSRARSSPREVVRLGLIDLINKEVRDQGGVWLEADPETGEVVGVYRPQSLNSFLWLQLGQVVADKVQLASCQRCGRLFDIAPPATRSSRKFCSDSCRTMASRSRRSRMRSQVELADEPEPKAPGPGSRRQGDDEGARVEGGPDNEVEEERKRRR